MNARRIDGPGGRIGWLLIAQDHGNREQGQHPQDQRQPEVAEDLETQGGDRDRGEDMDITHRIHEQVF